MLLPCREPGGRGRELHREIADRDLQKWHDGHIGVYIGNGEVVEAMGTRYGVVKTKLEGARWTHWLKIPYISYD